MTTPKTLYDKIWDAHVAHEADDGTCLLYIDRHLVHEVTSPQAFEGLRMSGRGVRAPNKTIAVPDHNVPTTTDREAGIDNEESRIQVEALDKNAREFGVHYYPVSDIRQGIVHIVGPEQGWTLPGMTVVCGDSHTATHGAFGALAHGIGTSEVEHVLATQTLIQKKSKNMKVEIKGKLRPGVTAKDITLSVIGATGTAGGTGYVIEYSGEAIRDLSMEGRMTVCNMAIEGGARAGGQGPGLALGSDQGVRPLVAVCDLLLAADGVTLGHATGLRPVQCRPGTHRRPRRRSEPAQPGDPSHCIQSSDERSMRIDQSGDRTPLPHGLQAIGL